MFHCLGFTASTAATANTDTAPVTDDVFAISNSHFLPQQDVWLQAAFFSGLTAARARIVSARLRQVTLPFIKPINLATLPVSRTPLADYRGNPLKLAGREELAAETTQTAAGPTQVHVGLFVGSQQLAPVPGGDILTMRGTATTTAGVEAWTSLTVTWADILPAGQYVVVGMAVVAATCVLARAIFENQIERPGCVGNTLNADIGHQMFRMGGMGLWGKFTSTRMPIIQVLSTAADVAQEIYLDIIKIA